MNNNIKNLVKLIIENPNLKVLPMVDSDIGGDDYSRYIGNIGESRIDEVYFKDERVYFKSNDEDELCIQALEDLCIIYEIKGEPSSRLEETAQNIVDDYEWEKVIVVEIDL
jgi:methylglyoxal synthase